MMDRSVNYNEPVAIDEGIFWIGYNDRERNLHCNPYIIIDGEEAVIIDSGSRTDFSTVMTRVMQTGINPRQVTALIYHHYDPDLCSSIPNFEQFLDSNKVKLISQKENNVFIRYYAGTIKMYCIESLDFMFTFSSGRKLQFIRTPYSHSAGSFVTFDEKTGTLFSSDLFGSYDKAWRLFTDLHPNCASCDLPEVCPEGETGCPIKGIYDFHRRIMTSGKGLAYAMKQIGGLDIQRIAPQHGGILESQKDIAVLRQGLAGLDRVGIDGFQ